MASDITTKVLIEIRDEMKGMRSELSGVRQEVRDLRADTSSGLSGIRGELKELRERQVDTEVRLATELVAVVQAVNLVRDEIKGTRVFRGQLEDHEQRIAKLEKKPRRVL